MEQSGMTKYFAMFCAVLSACSSAELSAPETLECEKPPPGYTSAYAWEEGYPRFAGVDYGKCDSDATTWQNDKYAFVFREGMEVCNKFGVI
jgi:hypothetical protein